MSKSMIRDVSASGRRYLTRGSSAPRHLICAGAIGYRGPRFDDNTDEAQLGTAAGEAMELAVTGHYVDLDDVAKQYNVDRFQLGAAYGGGWKVWEQLHPWFPEPQRQMAVAGLTTVGTADLVSLQLVENAATGRLDAGTLAVLDFKLGLSPDEHVAQLMSYGLALVDTYGFPLSGHVLGVEVHMMPARGFIHKFTQEQLEVFRTRLLRQHALAGRQFSPGDHCKYCPRNYNCAERDIWIRGTISALAEVRPATLTDRRMLANLWERHQTLERALKAYRKAVRISVQTEGEIELPGGAAIRLVPEEHDIIDPKAIVEPMREHELDPGMALKCTKKGLKEAIKAKAAIVEASGGKLNQAKTLREILARVDAAHGLGKKTVHKLRASK